MQRRQFLQAGAATSALLALPVAVAARAPAPRLLLARADDALAGTPFATLDHAPAAACNASHLRVQLDGWHTADGGAVLQALWLGAVYGTPQGEAAYLAWQHAPGRGSQRTRFVAERSTLRRFEVDYQLAGDTACRSEACALTRVDAPLLAPGHYVLAGPRRNGRRPTAAMLQHSGDRAVPLAGVRDFDYLAFRIEPIA